MNRGKLITLYKYIVYLPHINDYTVQYFTDDGINKIDKNDLVLVKEIGIEYHQIIHSKPEEWNNEIYDKQNEL